MTITIGPQAQSRFAPIGMDEKAITPNSTTMTSQSAAWRITASTASRRLSVSSMSPLISSAHP
ncbi:MAG: hypothetical protein AB7F22_07340 [Reyranella sp.]|uniref:hypothetical protein n=1 Tax=Reyranella sp. TaxID=1929291 RepID=UPI003D137F17